MTEPDQIILEKIDYMDHVSSAIENWKIDNQLTKKDIYKKYKKIIASKIKQGKKGYI